VEEISECHFERAGRAKPCTGSSPPSAGQVEKSVLNGFLHFAPVLSAKAETGAPVEMTVGLFYRATSQTNAQPPNPKPSGILLSTAVIAHKAIMG